MGLIAALAVAVLSILTPIGIAQALKRRQVGPVGVVFIFRRHDDHRYHGELEKFARECLERSRIYVPILLSEGEKNILWRLAAGATSHTLQGRGLDIICAGTILETSDYLEVTFTVVAQDGTAVGRDVLRQAWGHKRDKEIALQSLVLRIIGKLRAWKKGENRYICYGNGMPIILLRRRAGDRAQATSPISEPNGG